MKILCVIPSKGRFGSIAKKTLSWMPQANGFDWKVFVEPKEALLYKKAFEASGFSASHLVVLPDNDRRLGYSLYHCKKYAIAYGYDLVLKLDDDVSGLIDARAKKIYSADVLEKMVKTVSESMVNEPKLGAVGIDLIKGYYYVKNNPVDYLYKNAPVYGLYIIRPEIWDKTPECTTEEDCITTLSLFRAGYYTYTYNAAMQVAIYTNAGGEQSFDRVKEREALIPILKKKYPDLEFKYVVHEKNIYGGGIDWEEHFPKKQRLF